MTVGQERERGQNIILLTTDTPVTPECLKEVRALEHVAMAMPVGIVAGPQTSAAEVDMTEPKTKGIPSRIGAFTDK